MQNFPLVVKGKPMTIRILSPSVYLFIFLLFGLTGGSSLSHAAGFFTAVKNKVQKIENKVHETTQKIGEKLHNTAQKVGTSLTQKVENVASKISSTGAIGAQVGGLISKVNTVGANAVSKAETSVFKAAGKVENTLYKGMQAVEGKAIDLSEKAFNKTDKIAAKVGGNIIKKQVVKVAGTVKTGAVSLYQNSFKGIGDSVKGMVSNSKTALSNLKQGNVKGFVKDSAKVVYNGANAVTLGQVKTGVSVGKNYGKSFIALSKGNVKEAALLGQQAAIDSFKFAGGPVGMFLGPRSAEELNKAAVNVAKNAKNVGLSVATMAKNTFGKGSLKVSDFRAVVDAGAGFQNSVTNVMATGVTNVGVLRSGIKGGVGYINNATQDLGNAAVQTTAAAGDLAHGRFKEATKNTVRAMGNVAQGGGRLASIGVTAAQAVAGVVPGGQVAAIPLAVLGAATNIAGNSKTIVKGLAAAGKNQYAGVKELFSEGGSKKEAFKKIGMSMVQGAGVGALVGTSVIGGGAGKILGKGVGAVVGKVVGNITAAGTKAAVVASKVPTIALKANTIAKYAAKVPLVNSMGGTAQVSSKVANKVASYTMERKFNPRPPLTQGQVKGEMMDPAMGNAIIAVQ
jgi:hypothetical protein